LPAVCCLLLPDPGSTAQFDSGQARTGRQREPEEQKKAPQLVSRLAVFCCNVLAKIANDDGPQSHRAKAKARAAVDVDGVVAAAR